MVPVLRRALKDTVIWDGLHFASKVRWELIYYFYYYYATIIRGAPYDLVVILSHVRSGSTLLSHILATNPDVCGFGETMLPYRSPSDLRRVVVGRVLYMLNRFPRPGNERYVLDKILHNQLLHPENIGVLTDANCRIIFHLREPEATLKSIMRLWQVSESEALAHYVTRLQTLSLYAGTLDIGVPCVLTTYGELLDQSDKTFELLEDFLALSHPLKETYDLLPTTGKAGGDRSSFISKGHIVRQRQRETPPITLSDEVLKISTLEFLRCYERLTDRCRKVM